MLMQRHTPGEARIRIAIAAMDLVHLSYVMLYGRGIQVIDGSVVLV